MMLNNSNSENVYFTNRLESWEGPKVKEIRQKSYSYDIYLKIQIDLF